MGGGAMLRNVAKLATLGAGAGAGARAAAPPVCSICRAAPNSTPRAASSSCVCDTAPGSQSLQSAPPQRWGYDQDWVITGEHGEPPEYSLRDHLVFGKPPSYIEVEEATSELQDALTLGLVAPEVSSSRNLPPVSTIETDPSTGQELIKVDASDGSSEQTIDWIEPRFSFPGNNQGGYVAEAFQLLQSEPKVKEVVMSLAQDKAVWDAILNNDKVKEFRNQMQSHGHLNGDDTTHDFDNTEVHGKAGLPFGLNLFSSLFEDAKNRFFYAKEFLVDMIKGIFSAEKTAERHEQPVIDLAMKSCFFLAILVAFVVLLKRAPVA